MKIKNHLLALLAFIVVASCQVEDEISPSPIHSVSSHSGSMKLGRKLENPYSVANMKIALDSLQTSNGRIEESIDVETTHYYVKFIPLDETEYDVLKSDSTLVLYDYPLDYEIDVNGEYYHDPDVPEDQPTPQYCAVKVDFQFPDNVEYEIVEELFIPDDYSDEDNENGRIANEWFIEMLVNESLKLTGNLPDDAAIPNSHETDESPQGRTASSNSWRPAGRIMVWDDQIGTTSTSSQVFSHWEYYDCGDDDMHSADFGDEPETTPMLIEGGGGNDDETQCKRAIFRTVYSAIPGSYVPVVDVKVRARRWFTTHMGSTGVDGRYSADGTFTNDANYSIQWEMYHFSIRTGNFGQAILNGPKQYGDWNPKIGNLGATEVDNTQQYYALIFQGARDYYYGNRFGLASPPKNGALKPQVKIAARLFDKGKDSHAAQYARTIGAFPTLYIREYGLLSDMVYAVTAHELAHLAHWDMDRDAFRIIAVNAWDIPSDEVLSPSHAAIIESWANGVEWKFGMGRYRDQYGDANYEYDEGYKDQKIAPFNATPSRLIYTSIVVDMIDSCNQRDTICNPFASSTTILEYPLDRVSGYSIIQIEQALNGSISWNEWRNNLMYTSNSTSYYINELFANWY